MHTIFSLMQKSDFTLLAVVRYFLLVTVLFSKLFVVSFIIMLKGPIHACARISL